MEKEVNKCWVAMAFLMISLFGVMSQKGEKCGNKGVCGLIYGIRGCSGGCVVGVWLI